MNEYTALLAAVAFGALIAVSAVGAPLGEIAERMFTSAPADFSAKFIKP